MGPNQPKDHTRYPEHSGNRTQHKLLVLQMTTRPQSHDLCNRHLAIAAYRNGPHP